MLAIRSHRSVLRSPNWKRRLVGAAVAIGLVASIGPFAPPAGAAPLPNALLWNETTTNVQVNGSYLPVTGNFTSGDASTDIYWFSATTSDQIWARGNDGRHRSLSAPSQIDGSRIPLVGDFAGNDTLDDIFWYGPGAVTDVLWRAKGDGTFSASSFSVKGVYTPKVVHSKTGSDIVWWKAGWSITSIWDFGAARGLVTNRSVTNPAAAEPVPGDFNGDGNGDIFWFNPGIAAESISMGTAGVYTTVPAPSVYHEVEPVVVRLAEFGGAGHDHILWWSASNPQMAVWGADTGFRWSAIVVKMNTSATTKPIALPGATNTYIWNWDTVNEDHLWLRNRDGLQSSFGSRNTEPSSDAIPIPLATGGTTTQILWYRPGYGTDVLFTLRIAAP
jgi:hypothetical protein